MSAPTDSELEFPESSPATNLDEVWEGFDPTLAVDPNSEFYIHRKDHQLQKLAFQLKRAKTHLHAFLCGHRGSGKTTELKRLCLDEGIREKYFPILLTAQDFGETVNLSHDALLVEIGLRLEKEGKSFGMEKSLAEELNDWGLAVVKTFLHGEGAEAVAGVKGNAWLAFFKAQLSSRREWKREEKQILEPKVQDLVDILNRMAQDLKNKTGKTLLVVVDDLEKGESDAHRTMHTRLFQENYDILVQPRFSIIYTLPIYFRAESASRIPHDELYAFSALHIYRREDKKNESPPLDTEGADYKMMRDFVEKRVENPTAIFGEGALDELLRIGGGLFRETARAIQEAAYLALERDGTKIAMEDVNRVFDQIKKEYQPLIRGGAIKTLKAVLDSEKGWIEDVESFLQSRAVVEYENGDLWLDLRHVLKPYIRELSSADE